MSEVEEGARKEARRIHRHLFASPLPPLLEERYLKALEHQQAAFSEEERRAFWKALGRAGDLEALELAARKKRKLRILGSRFQLMVRLAETLPEYQKHFVNTGNRRPAAFLSLFWGMVRTLIKKIKGRIMWSRIEDG